MEFRLLDEIWLASIPMNVFGASISVILILVVSFAPRRLAILGMMAGVLYLSGGLAINVATLNLYPVRFLEMAGFARVMRRKEFSSAKLNKIDYAFLLFYGYTTLVFLLRSRVGQEYQIGLAVDAILCYFIFRGLLRTVSDLKCLLLDFIVLLIPFVMLVSIESVTTHNPFALLGAHPYVFDFRGGRPRCRGSFTYPDLMGTVGASFLPLYLGLFLSKEGKIRPLVGIGLCLMIVFFANSGGAASATAVGLVGWLLWILRHRMYVVRRVLVGGVIFLQLFMKAPIWWLPARVSAITGGDGWHRSELMDLAIRHADKWWLAGMARTETRDWFPYIIKITGGADITNQYLVFGLAAGVGAIFLFLRLLARTYLELGKALSNSRVGVSEPNEAEHLLWGLGVMLSVHMINWLGVSYFDQIYVVWFMQLATISSLTLPESIISAAGRERRVKAPQCKGDQIYER